MLYVHIYRNVPPAVSWNDLCCVLAPCANPPNSPPQFPPRPHLVNSVSHPSRCRRLDAGEERRQATAPQTRCSVWSRAFPPGRPTRCFGAPRRRHTASQSVLLLHAWQLKQTWRVRDPCPPSDWRNKGGGDAADAGDVWGCVLATFQLTQTSTSVQWRSFVCKNDMAAFRVFAVQGCSIVQWCSKCSCDEHKCFLSSRILNVCSKLTCCMFSPVWDHHLQ